MSVYCRAAIVAAIGFVAGPGQTASYTFTNLELAGFGNGGSASAQEFSINNAGDVVDRFIYRPGNTGSAQDNVYTLRTQKTDGSTELATTGTGFQTGALKTYPQVNDAGQVLSMSAVPASNGTNLQTLEIREPDGTRRILAVWGNNVPAGTPYPVLGSFSGFNAAINDNGDVAVIATSTTNKSQVIKFTSGQPGYDVIVEQEPVNGLFNFSGVDINNSGQVAFVASKQGNADLRYTTTTSVWVGDENGGVSVGASTPDGVGIHGRPDINDAGTIAVALGNTTGQSGLLIQESGEPADIRIFGSTTIVGGVQGVNLNDTGDVAYWLGGEVYLNDQLLVGVGDELAGLGRVVSNTGGAFGATDIRHNVSLNNSGQVVLNAIIGRDDGSGGTETSVATFRADPTGTSYQNPWTPRDRTDRVATSLMSLYAAGKAPKASPSSIRLLRPASSIRRKPGRPDSRHF